jgi:hypothetical protein
VIVFLESFFKSINHVFFFFFFLSGKHKKLKTNRIVLDIQTLNLDHKIKRSLSKTCNVVNRCDK